MIILNNGCIKNTNQAIGEFQRLKKSHIIGLCMIWNGGTVGGTAGSGILGSNENEQNN